MEEGESGNHDAWKEWNCVFKRKFLDILCNRDFFLGSLHVLFPVKNMC